MPSPTSLTLNRLRELGYIACPVERRIAAANIRKDAFGVGDVLAAHPIRREVLLVQATSADHVAHRLTKARAHPELAAWSRAGGLFQVWGWSRRAGWEVRVVELRAEDLAAVLITSPPRRGRRPKQRGLFDRIQVYARPPRRRP